jgi:hypothetical protein
MRRKEDPKKSKIKLEVTLSDCSFTQPEMAERSECYGAGTVRPSSLD